MQSIWANEDNYRKIFWSKILNFTWMHFHEYFIWLIPWINILFTISICFVHPWANKAYPDQTLSDLSLLFTVSIGFVHAWANNADPDQTLFDLSLHCLLRSVYIPISMVNMVQWCPSKYLGQMCSLIRCHILQHLIWVYTLCSGLTIGLDKSILGNPGVIHYVTLHSSPLGQLTDETSFSMTIHNTGEYLNS